MAVKVLVHWLFRIGWSGLLLSAVTFVASCTNDPREISQNRFMRMVRDQEIEQVTIFDDRLVEVRLTPDALGSDKYRNHFADPQQYGKRLPHFQFMIRSEQTFREDLAKAHPTFLISTGEKSSLSKLR